jgi:hypothetical protein
MWGAFVIIVMIIGVCWSEAKKSWAAEEAKHINANRSNSHRTSHRR